MKSSRCAIGALTAAGRSILLAVCAASVGAGCASGGRVSPNLSQSPTARQRAAVNPGSWDRVAVLQPGSRVIVTLIDGGRVEGTFRLLGQDELALTDSKGRDLGIAKSNIRRIVMRGEGDGLANGSMIGAAIGLGTAAAILAAAASGDGYVLGSAKWGAPLLLSAAGGVIGFFVDRTHRNDRQVYEEP
jgi:hypothetical protein